MDLKKINSTVNLKCCSQDECLQNTEYFCPNCQKDFCLQCQLEHTTNLDTKHHNITLYRNKIKHGSSTTETCKIHSGSVYKKFCKTCNIPFCAECKAHGKHNKTDIPSAREHLQKHVNEKIIYLRSDIIYMNQVMLQNLKADFKTSEKIKPLKVAMVKLSKGMKKLMDNLLSDGSYYKNLHRCLSQEIKLKTHIGKIQYYEKIHEKRLVKFLQFVKKLRPPTKEDTPTLSLHHIPVMTADIILDDVIKHLTKMKISKKGKRHIETKQLLQEMNQPILLGCYTVAGVDHCRHFSFQTPDCVWVSDGLRLVLFNKTTGDTLHRLAIKPNRFSSGLHSMNCNSELIYIASYTTINKLGADLKTETICEFDKLWRPICIYFSPSTEDMILGMARTDSNGSKLERYNKTFKLLQTIKEKKKGQALYRFPKCITENNNGDVVVCDRTEPFGGFGAVVVTDRDGRHRFSYTGRSQQGPIFMPFGICTDAFSRIFICDGCTNNVHVIDRNGQFLSSWNHLSSIKYWNNIISLPFSVGYDFNSHLLWIGSDYENKVLVIRYLDRHHNLTGMFENSLLFCHLLNSVHCFYLLITYWLTSRLIYSVHTGN